MSDKLKQPTIEICECDSEYSIEPHGDAYALYFGRCDHQHGYNLAKISELSHNCELDKLEQLLNTRTPGPRIQAIDNLGEWLCTDLEKDAVRNLPDEGRYSGVSAQHANNTAIIKHVAERIKWYIDNELK